MTEQISIRLGASPWRPTGDSELVQTFRFNDGPLAGVLRQADAAYHFECVEGHVDRLNLWRFVRLLDEELRDLEDPATQQRLEALTSGRPYVLAVAREGHGIVASAFVEDPALFGSPVEAASSLMRGFEADLESIRAVPLES